MSVELRRPEHRGGPRFLESRSQATIHMTHPAYRVLARETLPDVGSRALRCRFSGRAATSLQAASVPREDRGTSRGTELSETQLTDGLLIVHEQP
jgi:hypothetical protein